MQLFGQFPPGLWVVKRIDRFHFSHNDSESALVDVDLQKLPFEDPLIIPALQEAELSELLGKAPARRGAPESQGAPQPFIRRKMLASYLGALKCGDVLEAGKQIASLPTICAEIELTASTPLTDIRYDDPWRTLQRPEGWTPSYPYQVLNPFEYLMPTGLDRAQQPNDQLHISRSRCLVVHYNDVEYILPKMVIFQAFYGFNSRLINAFCNGPWAMRAPEVISFRPYESGLSTTLDGASGAWDIVLETGMPLEAARPIALFWFEPYARRCAEALHTMSLQDNQSRPGPHGNGWLASANIPHQLNDTPFKLSVEGFALRSFNQWANPPSRRRFLITSIRAASWPLQHQVIRAALHNSNEKGEVQSPVEEDRPYWRGQEPVTGDPNALATSTSDPHVRSAVNEFGGTPFRYVNAPPIQPLVKQSSKRFPPSAPPDSEGASSIVSAGMPSNAAEAPAKADITKTSRDPSQQFNFLIELMEHLVSTGEVDSFRCCGPDDPAFLIDRNGLPCWTLLSRASRRRGVVPRKGWEVIKVRKYSTGRLTPFTVRHARCALIVSIMISGAEIILFEIEPRPAETSAYRLVAFQRDKPIKSAFVESTLDSIREAEGRFDDAQLGQIFGSLTGHRPSAHKHSYKYASDPLTGGRFATGLNADALGSWLASVAQGRDDCSFNPRHAL